MPWCTFSAVAGPGVVSAIKGASSSGINGGGAGSGRQRVQPLRLHRLAGMPDVAEAEPDPRRWLSLLTCCSALFMTLLDVSVTNVALPSIGRATGAAPSQLQWVVSGYTLAFGLVPVLAGRLGDDHGRRLMFQVGVGSFTATSILAGLSPSVGVLIGARVLQGLAGGPNEGWRLVFFINVPVGAAVILLARRLLPADPALGRHRLDTLGAGLLGA